MSFCTPLNTMYRPLASHTGCWSIRNSLVSFSLSLWVACRSRQIRFDQASTLAGRVWQLLRSRPREFFLPPKAERTTGEGAQL